MFKQRWQLKPYVHVIGSGEDYVLLSHLGQRLLLKTAQAHQIRQALKALQNPLSVQELRKEISPSWSEKSAGDFIKKLESRKLVELLSDQESASFEVSISLIPRLKVPEGFMKGAQRVFFENPFPTEKVDSLFVLLASSKDHEALEVLAEKAVHSKVEIVPVLLDPYGAIVGPFSTAAPGYPCLSCVSYRLKANMNSLDYLEQIPLASHGEVTALWPATYWQRLESIVQEEILKLKEGDAYSNLQKGAYIFDFLNHRSHYEDVFPVPGCPCSLEVDPDPDELLMVSL